MTIMVNFFSFFFLTYHFFLMYLPAQVINNWPVTPANEFELDSIKTFHYVQPLPAYDIQGNLIEPSLYEEKFTGAIARVCFTIVYYPIKQKHIFNALVRDTPSFDRPPLSSKAL